MAPERLECAVCGCIPFIRFFVLPAPTTTGLPIVALEEQLAAVKREIDACDEPGQLEWKLLLGFRTLALQRDIQERREPASIDPTAKWQVIDEAREWPTVVAGAATSAAAVADARRRNAANANLAISELKAIEADMEDSTHPLHVWRALAATAR